MNNSKFNINKKALIFVMIFSFLVGFIFRDNSNESDSFFSADLFFRAFIIAMIGGSVVALSSYLQYKKNIKDK